MLQAMPGCQILESRGEGGRKERVRKLYRQHLMPGTGKICVSAKIDKEGCGRHKPQPEPVFRPSQRREMVSGVI